MNTSDSAVLLCFGVVLLARLTMAIGGFEMELLLSKMDYLQDKLQEVEQTMKTTIEKVDSKFEIRINTLDDSLQNAMKIHLQTVEASKENHKNLLAKLEKEVVERIGKVASKFETRMNLVENSLQSTIKEVEQTIKTSMQQAMERSIKERHIILQNLLIRLVKNDKERIENIGSKHETSMQDIENSLKKGLEATVTKTRGGLEDLKNQLNFNMSQIRQHQITQIKSYQETSETELKKIGEYKNTLDMLTHSIRNISIQGTFNTQLLNFIQTFDGGWTVIQRRFNGSLDFYRNWTEYRNGFGTLDGEFCLGLEIVHQMTKNRPHELLVEVKDFHGNYGYAKYKEFEIGNESEKYALKKLGTYSGTAGDAMRSNKDEQFSTFDRDSDQFDVNCAEHRHGAWWYYKCSHSNLNGRYQNTTDYASAMSWYIFKNDWRDLSYSRMMIRGIID